MGLGVLEASSYSDFRSRLAGSHCQACALAKRRTHIVVDRGNPEASVLLVGEAPGEKEDLEGRAFVGRSGRLLDDLFKGQGFDTQRDCLIVNVVKCRPPDNRPPSTDEVDSCRPFLKKQIDFLRPKLVGLLGATAMKRLFPEKKGASMKAEVGRFFEHDVFPGAAIMPLFHPAYLLRDPRKRPEMERYLKHFVELWREKLLQSDAKGKRS